ncbi:MAG: hypothetical protein IPG82_10840 [Saprospiraceae bacterium]|nr:hypothetical protein [Saprospiraceae bacterium]
MSSIKDYLRKTNFKPRLSADPVDHLNFIVVIPCHDEPDLEATLQSLELAARPYHGAVEIIVVINDAIHHQPEVIIRNKQTVEYLETRKNEVPAHFIYETGILSKKAGVGYARKIGMDEGIYRFDLMGTTDGILCSMDADTIVEANYFTAIAEAYAQNNRPCKTIYFEHDLALTIGSAHLQAITHYELHLRYYINALRYAGFPHAYQTLGSAFCVQANAYAALGGMPQRQAGEDFYFIHKFSINDQVSEINSTTVKPSSRRSHRVPFGTGRAVEQALSHKSELTLTYPLKAFEDLKRLLSELPSMYQEEYWSPRSLDESTQAFLTSIEFDRILKELKSNTSNFKSFVKRFFQKIDAFMMMKYVHFLRDNFYGTDDLVKASERLLNLLKNPSLNDFDPLIILDEYRRLDRGYGL